MAADARCLPYGVAAVAPWRSLRRADRRATAPLYRLNRCRHNVVSRTLKRDLAGVPAAGVDSLPEVAAMTAGVGGALAVRPERPAA